MNNSVIAAVTAFAVSWAVGRVLMKRFPLKISGTEGANNG